MFSVLCRKVNPFIDWILGRKNLASLCISCVLHFVHPTETLERLYSAHYLINIILSSNIFANSLFGRFFVMYFHCSCQEMTQFVGESNSFTLAFCSKGCS